MSPASSYAAIFRNSLCFHVFLISPLIAWLTHSFFSRVFFNLHAFGGFPDFFLWLISSFITLWSENMHGMISILVFYEGLFCDPVCDLSWRMLHVHLRRKYILLLWDASSKYICQVHLIQCIIRGPCFFIDPVSR